VPVRFLALVARSISCGNGPIRIAEEEPEPTALPPPPDVDDDDTDLADRVLDNSERRLPPVLWLENPAAPGDDDPHEEAFEFVLCVRRTPLRNPLPPEPDESPECVLRGGLRTGDEYPTTGAVPWWLPGSRKTGRPSSSQDGSRRNDRPVLRRSDVVDVVPMPESVCGLSMTCSVLSDSS